MPMAICICYKSYNCVGNMEGSTAAVEPSAEERLRVFEYTLSKFVPAPALPRLLEHFANELAAVQANNNNMPQLRWRVTGDEEQLPTTGLAHSTDRQYWWCRPAAMSLYAIITGSTAAVCFAKVYTEYPNLQLTPEIDWAKLLPTVQLLAMAMLLYCAINAYRRAYVPMRHAALLLLRMLLMLALVKGYLDLAHVVPHGWLATGHDIHADSNPNRLLQELYASNALFIALPGFLLRLPLLCETGMVVAMLGCTGVFGLLHAPLCESAFLRLDVAQRFCQFMACILPLLMRLCLPP